MNIDNYQDWTDETAIGHTTSETEGVTTRDALIHNALAVNGEAGEIAEAAKRISRGDGNPEALGAEIADVIWYLARLADELDLDLSDLLAENIEKLSDRKARDVIAGSGDDR